MEKEKKQIKYHKGIAIVVSVVTPILFLLFVYFSIGMTFEQNDDLFISRLLSGAITGTPDYQAVYINFWISAPLSILYRLTRVIPWWGIFLSFCFVFSHAIFNLYAIGKNSLRLIPVPLFDLILSFSYIFYAGKIQYTSIAIFLGATGYLCLILGEEKKRDIILFFIFEFLAFCLRSKGMLLVQPLGLLIFLSVIFIQKKNIKKSIIGAGACLLSVLVLGAFGRIVSGEYSEEWKDFYSFNKMREEFYDYSGCPSYTEVKPILDKYNVSEIQWDSFTDYDTSAFPMDGELVNELYDFAKQRNVNHFGAETIKNMYKNSIRRKDAWPVLILLVLSVVLIIQTSKYIGLIPVFVFSILHISIWCFLCFKGRMLDRVSLALLSGESILLAAYGLSFISDKLSEKKKTFLKIFTASAFVILTAVALFVGLGHCKRIKEENNAQMILWDSMRQLENYCEMHPENKYIIDISSISSVHGEAFTKESNQKLNYRYSGGWFAATPSFKESMNDYLDGSDGFYYIVFDFGEGWDRMQQGTANRYKFETGSEGIKEDEILVSSGGTFLVYRFDIIKK